MSQGWQEVLYKVDGPGRHCHAESRRTGSMPGPADMADQLRAAFTRADADREVRAIVVTGAGRGFCAGADMARLSSGRPPASGS